MKNILALFCVVFLLAGCGDSGSKKTIAKLDPNKDYLAEGMQYLKESDGVKAIKSFDNAIKKDPTDPEAYLMLGQVYFHMRQYPQAIDTFSAAARVAPDRADIYYLLAMAHGLAGETEFAINNAKRSVELARIQKDEENFKRSLVLLQGLMQAQK